MSRIFSAMDVSASGLMAERVRMETTANNIANANTTMTASGDPYRKQSVVFSAKMDQQSGLMTAGNISGVQIVGIQEDQTDFPTIHSPGHADADENGVLRLSNVKIPNEMVDLITASRSYEANLKSLTIFKEMVEQSLVLLQGGR